MQTKIYFSGGGGGFWGVWGAPRPHPGVARGSENDTLLPMTMICDRLKNSDKTIRHSRLAAGNIYLHVKMIQ